MIEKMGLSDNTRFPLHKIHISFSLLNSRDVQKEIFSFFLGKDVAFNLNLVSSLGILFYQFLVEVRHVFVPLRQFLWELYPTKLA